MNDSSHLSIRRLGPLTKASITSPLSCPVYVCVCASMNVLYGFGCVCVVRFCVMVSHVFLMCA